MKKEKFKTRKNREVSITLNTCTFNRIRYGAGMCGVTVGTLNMEAVAVKAGKHKHITNVYSAIEWLVLRGCNRALATDLVGEVVQRSTIKSKAYDTRTAAFITRDHPVAERLIVAREDYRDFIKHFLAKRDHFIAQRETIDKEDDPAGFARVEQQLAHFQRLLNRLDDVGDLWILNWKYISSHV